MFWLCLRVGVIVLVCCRFGLVDLGEWVILLECLFVGLGKCMVCVALWCLVLFRFFLVLVAVVLFVIKVYVCLF